MPVAGSLGATRLAFHQQAADELGSDQLSRAGEKGAGEVLGKRGGYGCGFVGCAEGC